MLKDTLLNIKTCMKNNLFYTYASLLSLLSYIQIGGFFNMFAVNVESRNPPGLIEVSGVFGIFEIRIVGLKSVLSKTRVFEIRLLKMSSKFLLNYK